MDGRDDGTRLRTAPLGAGAVHRRAAAGGRRSHAARGDAAAPSFEPRTETSPLAMYARLQHHISTTLSNVSEFKMSKMVALCYRMLAILQMTDVAK